MANDSPTLRTTFIVVAAISGLCALSSSAGANDAYEIEISGVVEIEATGGRTTDGAANSDISVATIEIGIDTTITDNVSAHLLLLHEENDTDLEIDEGTITLSELGSLPIAISAGQMYVPFGHFESHMISDPLTLELGETRESVVQFGAVADNIHAAIYTFKGATRQANDSDRVKSIGANIGFTIENNGFNLDSGISYLSNMAETDTIEGIISNSTTLTDTPAGIGLHAIVRRGPLTMIAEYTGANDSFDTADLAFNGNGAKPGAYNIEAGFELSMFGKEATLALAAQGSRDAQVLSLPESRLLGSINVALREQTSLGFEWAKSDDYGTNEGGTGRATNMYTAQIAVEF